MKFEEMINTIQLGDCFDLLKNIPDKSIDCIYVDVPYLYTLGGTGHSDLCNDAVKHKMELMGLGKYYDKNLTPQENMQKVYQLNEAKRICANSRKKEISLINSDITNGFDYKKFIKEAFRIMKKPNIFIWCSPMQILDIMTELKKYSDSTVTILTWCKTNPIPTTNNNWLSDIEYCLYLRDGIKLNDGYDLKSKWFISPINQIDKEKYKHPTIKPLELVKRHILHTTNEGGVILDAFCGSGTTCVAAKETGRRYIGMEIDPEYHKIAVDRINGITANGQTSIFTDFDNL